jgi:hypothetical protein
MAAPNSFAFTGSRNSQSNPSDVNLRAKLARNEREIATLQRDLREANDANGVARTNKAANNKVDDAQRETQRVQMAERIARNALDDLRYQLKMAESANAELEEKVKLQQEHSRMENGELQVEPETSQDSPANASAAADNPIDMHAKCQCERAELITQFQELCKATGRQHADEKTALDAELQKAKAELGELKADSKEEIEQKDKALAEAQSARDKLCFLKVEYAELNKDFDEQVERRVEEVSRTNKELQDKLRILEKELKQVNEENGGLREENSGFKIKSSEMCDEITKLEVDLKHQEEVEKHLTENNERILLGLHDEQQGRMIVTAERDELKEQLVETGKVLEVTSQRRDALQEECETSRGEYEDVIEETQEQLAEFQKDAERLVALNEGLRNDIAAKVQCIDRLERGIEVLKSQNEELKSENELLKKPKNASRSQSVNNLVQGPAPDFTSRPNNNRSVSMASHTSLADELGLDSDHSDRSSIDEGFMPKHAEFDFSQVEYIFDDAPYQPVKPHLTVAVGDAVTTAQRIRQDSPQEHSLVDHVSSTSSPHRLQPLCGVSECTVADFAPSQPVNPALTMSLTTAETVVPIQPRSALLAVSNITSVESGTFETGPVPQQLTMHVFKQSVIQIDPESGRVCVTDPYADRMKYENIGRRAETLLRQTMSAHQNRDDTGMEPPPPYYSNWVTIGLPQYPVQHRAVSAPQRRSPLDFYPASAGQWPIGDESADQRAASVATQTVDAASESSTVADDSPSSVAMKPCTVSYTRASGLDLSMKTSVLLLLFILTICSTRLLPVLEFLLAIPSTLLQIYFALYKPVPIASRTGLDPKIHYVLHAVMAFYCWRFWIQVHAWEQVNGVGYGEGFGSAYDNFGPYGNGHPLLSMLPYNWVSADSHLPAKVIASTASAFEGVLGLGPTPSF